MTVQYRRTDLRIRARNGRPGDGAAIAAILGRSDTRLAALGPGAGRLLDRLLAEDRVRAGCIETSVAGGPPVIEAAGLSTFLADAVTAAYLDRPEPHFAARLLARTLSGEDGLLLGETGIARANSIGELDLFILGFGYSCAMDAPHVGALLARAIEHFVSAHAGFHIRRLMREDPAEIAEMFQRSGMRTLATFNRPAEGGSARVATLLERNDINPLFPVSPAMALFQFQPPRIFFTRAERRVLIAALEGASDVELATWLGMSLPTVKRTWRSIFDRVRQVAPDVLGPAEAVTQTEGVRGLEKRRHLLAYLRESPQETRPFLDTARGRASSD